MDVALKIWRYDAETGERELRDYEVEAPEWACLLDVLDIVKDQVDGTLSFRKSCRMMICGSCGMRMDGRAVLACKEAMLPIVEAGHVPVISAMGNLPIVKDLVVDMGPFWQKMRAMKPWLEPGYLEAPEEKEFHVSPAETEVIHKEALCINCGCCVSECNSMESDPEFLGPPHWPGMRFVGTTPATRRRSGGSRSTTPSTGSGLHALLLLPGRCPKASTRDAIAKLGAEPIRQHGIDRDMVCQARECGSSLRQDDGAGSARPSSSQDAGHRHLDQADEVRDEAGQARKGAAALPAARRRERQGVARALQPRQGAGRDGAARNRQGEKVSRTSSSPRSTPATRRRPRSESRVLQGLSLRRRCRPRSWTPRPRRSPRAGPRARGAGVGHVLRRRRHPRGGADYLPPPERRGSRVRRERPGPTR